MDVNTLYHRTVECWADRVNAVHADQWNDPTPCTAWSVRDLVNHVAAEDMWTVPLMEGATIEEVGDRLDGDVLGEDPVASALEAAKHAVTVVAERLPRGERVHLSYGEEAPGEYVRQLAVDHLIHSWDLAAATGGTTHLDPHLVSEVTSWFDANEEALRSAGLIGPPRPTSGDPQGDLLARAGRDHAWGPNHALVTRFSDAFAARDVDLVMSLMTDDCVFESTSPGPDGKRFEGQAAVRAVWEELLATTDGPEFETEEIFVHGDRGTVRWRYSWREPDGSRGHVRGVDVLRVRDGKVAEKLSYVKG